MVKAMRFLAGLACSVSLSLSLYLDGKGALEKKTIALKASQ